MNVQNNLLRTMATKKPTTGHSQPSHGRSSMVPIRLLIITGLLFAARAFADGCFISGHFEDLHAPEQKVAIVWDGRQETMVLSTRVHVPELSDFGWIIPIESKSKPVVELANPAVFTQ